jgi:hypothetical protein
LPQRPHDGRRGDDEHDVDVRPRRDADHHHHQEAGRDRQVHHVHPQPPDDPEADGQQHETAGAQRRGSGRAPRPEAAQGDLADQGDADRRGHDAREH